MTKKVIKELLKIDGEILSMCFEVAFIKKDDRFALVEYTGAKMGGDFNYFFRERIECHLIYQDYCNQVFLKGRGVLNLGLVDK